ncbi:MAG: aquaporin [Planctomycetia bacterium]|nr:aquaporin [Planctomycetia bacterium]
MKSSPKGNPKRRKTRRRRIQRTRRRSIRKRPTSRRIAKTFFQYTRRDAVEKSAVKKYAAEAIGTFCLVLAGTGAIVVNDVRGGVISHVGVALTFGLVVMAMIYTLGDVSGAHINPAVTVAFWVARRFDGRLVLPYIVAQCCGALAASVVLRVLFVDHVNLGATLPAGPWWQSLVLETLLTFILMFVILNVSTGAKEKGIMAGAAIGSVVGFEALFAGPICGASMNPARSLAPAIVSGQLAHLWIYLVGPVLGAALAVVGCRCVQPTGCCTAAETGKACG